MTNLHWGICGVHWYTRWVLISQSIFSICVRRQNCKHKKKKKKKPKVCENHLFNLKEIKKQFEHVISGQNYPKSFIFDRLQKEKIVTAKI